jgi:hypothetical protein
MARRGAMWPTELSNDPRFLALTQPAQWLLRNLWLHPDLNAGGFVAIQVEVWAKSAYDLTPEEVEASMDELLARNVIAVDDNTGELFVKWFIEYDSSRKPNIYINAMRAIQTARSPALRRTGLTEIERLHPPPLKRKPNTADEIYEKLERERDEAFRELWARVMKEPFGNRSGTVREPFANHSRTIVEQEGEAEYEGEGGAARTRIRTAELNATSYGECVKCRQAQSLGSEARDGENAMRCWNCNYEFAEPQRRANTDFGFALLDAHSRQRQPPASAT